MEHVKELQSSLVSQTQKDKRRDDIETLNKIGKRVQGTAWGKIKMLDNTARTCEHEAWSLVEELKDLDPDPVLGHPEEARGWARDKLNSCLRELIYTSSEQLQAYREMEKQLLKMR